MCVCVCARTRFMHVATRNIDTGGVRRLIGKLEQPTSQYASRLQVQTYYVRLVTHLHTQTDTHMLRRQFGPDGGLHLCTRRRTHAVLVRCGRNISARPILRCQPHASCAQVHGNCATTVACVQFRHPVPPKPNTQTHRKC